MTEPYVSILLDIKQQQGAITSSIESIRQELRDGAQSRQRLEDGQGVTREMIAPIIASVNEMKPQVDELMGLKQKFGGVILTLSVFWGLICAGFVYFSDIIKAKFGHG